MSNKLKVLHYTEDESEWNKISSTATKESLHEVLASLGTVESIEEWGSSWCFNYLERDGRLVQIWLQKDGKIIDHDYFISLELYVGMYRWFRKQLPETLSISVIDPGGAPFFVVDFDNLEDQLRSELGEVLIPSTSRE